MNSGHDVEDVVIDSTGSVFADLGIDMSEEDMFKVNIARAISRIIQNAGYTQVEAARAMGLDQPKVSALVRGRLKGFTSERLIRCLLFLGWDIDIKVRKSARERGSIKLVA